MSKSKRAYKRLDKELMREIAQHVIDIHREDEDKRRQLRHNYKRANIKLLLKNYREIVFHVDEAVYEASQMDDDSGLQSILELMEGSHKSGFHVESIKKSAATSKIIVSHMDKMLESYRHSVELYGKDEDKRRYRIIRALYIDEPKSTVAEVAEAEFIDQRTVYRDIDAAAERLAVLFFGAYGLRFL